MAESAEPTVLEPGAVIGKYRLTTKLGEGGMGVVFVAVHEKLGRDVAFKVLKKEYASAEEVAIRFQQEAEAVTRIGHPNIVAVYDFGRLPDGGLYYVMEKVQGQTLTKRMRVMPLSESEIRDVFLQLLSALAAAHNLGIVHRDLKPDNIILLERPPGERPLIKLLDFGVAKVRDDQRAGPLTTAGALLGTPKYMAPEQVKGAQAVDGRADIYAVGVMLYEALCGRAPFEGKMMQLLMAHVGQEAEAPSLRSQQVGGIVRDKLQWELIDPVVMKALAKDPEQRYQDCRSFAEALDAALSPSLPQRTPTAALPAVALPTDAARPTKQPRPKGLFIAAGLTVTLFIAGGVAIVSALRSPSTDDVLRADPGAEGDKGRRAPAEQAPRGLPEAIATRATQVIDQAQGGGAAARRSVMEAIEEVRSRRFLARVATALGDDNPAVRRAAAQAALAIGRAGDTELLQALREAAGQSVGAVAVEIAAARLGLGEAAVAEELQAMARRAADPATRLRAALALSQAGRLKAAQLRAAVAAADKAGGARPELRRAALARLVVLEDPTVLRQIQDALGNEADRALLLEAAEVLARAGDQRGPELLLKHAAAAQDDATTGRTRADPAAALARQGDARAVPLLLPLLKEGNEHARARAAAALGCLAAQGKWHLDPQALAPLLDDPKVQVAAAVALLGQSDG